MERRRRCDSLKEAVKLTTRQPGARKQGTMMQEKTQEQNNAEKVVLLAQEGEYSRALQALTSTGMAQQSAATTAEMQAKHPAAASPLGILASPSGWCRCKRRL